MLSTATPSETDTFLKGFRRNSPADKYFLWLSVTFESYSAMFVTSKSIYSCWCFWLEERWERGGMEVRKRENSWKIKCVGVWSRKCSHCERVTKADGPKPPMSGIGVWYVFRCVNIVRIIRRAPRNRTKRKRKNGEKVKGRKESHEYICSFFVVTLFRFTLRDVRARSY